MTIKMLIDAKHEEETRVAIVHGNRVEEFDYESSAKKQIKGNIYLAKITRVEPSLQAAFVEYGGNRHGFLAFSEIHPDYYQIPVSDREALIAEEAAAYASLLDEDDDDPVEKKTKTKRKPRRKVKAKSETDNSTEEEVTPEQDKSAEDKPDVKTDNIEAVDSEKAKTPKDINVDTVVEEDVKAKPKPKTRAKRKTKPAAKKEEALEANDSEKENDLEKNGDDDSGSITKAESIFDTEVIIEKDPIEEDENDDPDDQSEEDNDSDYNDDDKIEIEGAHLTSEEEDEEAAEEKMRIKIAKGLRRKYKIQEVIKKNQIVLIQVVKEERGNKGAALTTYLSLPGRYCVLMPNTLHGGGVSRKIANAGDRKSLKKILADLEMPSGIACIIRTAGQNRTKTEIKRDFDYLIRTWEGIRERTLKSVAPVMINEEGDLIKRSLRDLYTREVDEILVEGEKGYKTARNFMRLLMPSHARKIKHYTDNIPLLHKYQVENQLDSMYSPTVQLKSGGYIVINPTEALVSIDVNSGKATKEHNIEETARKTNLEAAEEVARQLRLRDMAGLIVIDFIDMENRGNNRAVEHKLKECLKSDRARIQVGRISSFGLMEMSRQRLRAGVLESSTSSCPHCEGSGLIRSVESQALHILRALEEEGIKGRNNKVTVYLPNQTAIYLLNNKRAKLVSMEEQYSFTIEITIDSSLTESAYRLEMPNMDIKKPERHNQSKQVQSKQAQSKQAQSKQAKPNNYQDNRKEDDERSTNSRRNRQRNQSRKNRVRNPRANDENQDELPTSIDNKGGNIQENISTDNSPQETGNSDNQEAPRRRRRRPRRNNRQQTEATSSDNGNEAVTSSDSATETNSPIETQNNKERPKRQRQPRSRKSTNDKAESTNDQNGANITPTETKARETKTDENKINEKKSSRRPYPPQARSRRKTTDTPKQSPEKTVEADSAPQLSPKMEPKVETKAAPSPEPEKDPAPKKSGWWQRTFG